MQVVMVMVNMNLYSAIVTKFLMR